MRFLIALVCGSLFGAGLVVSGMTDTSKVQGWLDIFGAWDPTLAFVLCGAIIPMLIAWQVSARMGKPLFGETFPPRSSGKLDRNIVIGSVFFGIGWALVGLCPGPAMAVLSYGGRPAAVFFAAMVAGMYLRSFLRRRVVPV